MRDTAEPTPTLRVLTMALLSPDYADWSQRRRVLRRVLSEVRPDVVALQEVDCRDGYEEVRYLLGTGYSLSPHSARSENGVGAVLASRVPPTSRNELDLRVTARVDLPWSAAVAAEIRLPAPFGPTLFVHYKPTWHIGYAHERELQAVACARFIDDLVAGRDMHVVVLGDLDDTPDSSSIRFWTGRQALGDCSVAYRDAWESAHPGEPGHTFTPANPFVRAGEMALESGRRIDYIMVRCGPHGPTLDVVDSRRVLDQPVDGVWASDHFGLLAVLQVPAHKPGTWI
ncbi:MAG TPA: endonuclease/exonuclease/phosphatase family protein [Thermomicrobiales bacterium]|jgi:endonuclease/exonuclease/phosphatase family metal-dependent hydrolase|nr:endonuclease/exonuclease/phosphatase family protein [Thermomicrobiales bacterium]